jgi:hypothetical protein
MPRNKKEKQTEFTLITLRLPKEKVDRFQKIANKQNVPRYTLLKKILLDFLEKEDNID